jgi:hypothetical protein
VSRALDVPANRWVGAARRAFAELAPILALIPDLAGWTPGEKRALVRIVRAKAAPTEAGYLRLMRRHAKLQRAIVNLGSGPSTRSG